MFKEVKNDEGEQTALLRSFFHFFFDTLVQRRAFNARNILSFFNKRAISPVPSYLFRLSSG